LRFLLCHWGLFRAVALRLHALRLGAVRPTVEEAAHQ
jgi:hypothetical protein